MPIYLFRNKDTGEIQEVFLGINDEKKHPKNQSQWERIFTIPQISADVNLNAFDEKSFLTKTASKKGTFGDLFDLSKEASLKRQETDGIDKVKEKYYSDYAQSRNGSLHPDVRKENLKNELKKSSVDIEF